MQESPLRLRTVLTWVDVIQFDMARQVLEEAGIPFDTRGRTLASTYDPSCVFVANQLSLQVLEADFDRARSLLEDTVGKGVVADA